jgi:PIN domain nuclease of toxin-antitoxin system
MVRTQVIYLDTHAVMAAYQGEFTIFGQKALQLFESDDDLRISPMVFLELEFLREIKRIHPSAAQVVDALKKDIGLKICDVPFAAVAMKAVAERWTRDPFDRFIVAQARLASAPLITRDRVIRAHYAAAMG